MKIILLFAAVIVDVSVIAFDTTILKAVFKKTKWNYLKSTRLLVYLVLSNGIGIPISILIHNHIKLTPFYLGFLGLIVLSILLRKDKTIN